MSNLLYTSNTAVETFHECPRERFLVNHYLGTGIVPKSVAIPLATGIHVHNGIAELMKVVKNKKPLELAFFANHIEDACNIAKQGYLEDVKKFGLSGDGLRTNAAIYHTVTEQTALIEALIRAWVIVELPQILNRFTVAGVEVEIEVIKDGVSFQSRADAILQEKGSGDVYVYSLKTVKQWGKRNEDSYRENLQGIHETWALEQFLLSKGMGKRVMGVRFCFLVKGQRREDKWSSDIPENRIWVTYNPLIRGYRRITPVGYEYAHSWEYANPANKSGKSVIGNSYSPFFVWQHDKITVKAWIEAIRKGQIQPEAGEVLRSVIVTPAEYFRNDNEIKHTIRQTFNQEGRIKRILEDFVPSDIDLEDERLDLYFVQHKNSCRWPTTCGMHRICYRTEVRADPLGSGFYVRRTPHHQPELEALREDD